MKLLRYVSLSSLLAVGLFAAPAFASAATLYVQTNVTGGDLYPSDFHIYVDGHNANPHDFSGSSADRGKKVTLDEGYYQVTVANPQGYVADYSGCSGYIQDGQTRYCTIDLQSTYYHNFSYNNCYNYNCGYNYNNCSSNNCYGSSYGYNNYSNCSSCGYNYTYPTYTYPTYTYPAVQKGYVPYLPNTGFEPVSGAAVAFALVVLAVAGFFLYPYVARALAVVLR